MKDRKLTDQEFETLARTVVSRGCNTPDLERLVSDPKLYEGVLTRIAAECEVRPQPHRFAWKRAVAFVAAVIVVSAWFVAYFSSRSEAPRANKTTVPDTISEIKPRPYAPPSEERAMDEPELVKSVMKPVEKQPAVKAGRPKPSAAKETEPVFHPIGFAERAEDAAIDGRIVRVEMPRSALFALGVDLPLENGTRSVKAELLVGADGSPRAIRLVE